MYKRFLCCTAALTLAAGGLTALPAADIKASAYVIDESKIRTSGDYKYVVWGEDVDGDTELTEDTDYNTTNAVEILDYKITGDTIEFPEEIDGKPVVFINSAPLKNSKVKKVKLPSGFYFFYDHSDGESSTYTEDREGLAQVLSEIPTLEAVDVSSEYYKSRNGVVYSNDDDEHDEYADTSNRTFHVLYFVPPAVSSYTVPSDIEYIASYAFLGNEKLTTLTIPKKVLTIGEGAFRNCSSLKSITVNAPITELWDDTFRDCHKLENVKLPDSLGSIRNSCFYDCTSLKSITIPDGVFYIGSFAFFGCSSLKNVDIGKHLVTIDDGAFSALFNLKSLALPETIREIYPGSVGMCYSAEEHIDVPIPGFKLYCYPGAGEKYAKESGIDYELIATTIKDCKVTLTKGKNYTYTGKLIKPAVTVKYKGKTLKKGTDYKVIYNKYSKEPGRCFLYVKGINKYCGKVKLYYNIKPAQSKVTSLRSPKKKAIKLKWKRDKVVDGYQILVSYNKNFKKKAKTVIIKKNSVTAKTVTGLKSGKRCYVKMRAYKLVEGKKLYGKCSKTRSIVCK